MESKKEAKQATKMPTAQEMFKAGVHFGHETSRWNPKMGKYIYDSRGNIHIIDVTKTSEQLKIAYEFLKEAASKGEVIIVGTKKQAAKIIQDRAIESGAHFVTSRWAGGLLTNFKMVKKSFNRLLELEKNFEEGVEGRTKYEVSLMKKEWQSLSRLYDGVKTLNSKPTAVIVVDAKFEKNAVNEARKLNIPVVGIVDSNTDPDVVDYAIPANDDAISSITLLMDVIADAIKTGNKGNGVKHQLKDYSKVEVKITKSKEEDEDTVEELQSTDDQKTVIAPTKKTTKKSSGKGILEVVQEAKEKKKQK